MAHKISIVLSYIDSQRTLDRCVSALERQDYPNFDILLIEGSKERITEAQGQIKGIKESDGDIVAFTNSDCYVPIYWLSRLAHWIEKGYHIALGRTIRGGDIYSYAWNAPLSVVSGQRSGLGFGFSNCIVRKEVFQDVPIRNMVASQDADFLMRAIKARKTLVVDPTVVVYHDHPLGSLTRSMRQLMLASENYTFLLRENFGGILGDYNMGLQLAFLRYIKEFLSTGRTRAAYGTLIEYDFVRFMTKISQLCGFGVGAFRRGVVNAHSQ